MDAKSEVKAKALAIQALLGREAWIVKFPDGRMAVAMDNGDYAYVYAPIGDEPEVSAL